LNNYW